MAKGRVTSCAVVPRGSKVQVCVKRKGEVTERITGPEDVCRILRGAKNADRENFVTLYLDVGGGVIGIDETHKGVLTGVDVHPREVFKGALAVNAASVVIAHNHPSGDPTPSNDDIDLTSRLKRGGDLLGIPVLDHVVVAARGCASVRETQPHLFGEAVSKKLDAAYPSLKPGAGTSNIRGDKK